MPNNDAIIATEIVQKLFKHIDMCVQHDRSKFKLNMLEKGMIKGMISNKTLKGINSYILSMHPIDVKNLMDDLDIEFSKRKK